MKKKYQLITWTAILVMSFVTNSCTMMDRADKRYQDFAYSKAIPLYKKALEKEVDNTEAWSKLGDCYRVNNQTDKAEECYAVAAKSPNSKSSSKLNYAEMLMSNGKYEDARIWMNKYAEAEPGDLRARELAAGLNHIENFFAEKDNYKIQKLNINTGESEFGQAFYKEGIIFTSSRVAKKNKTGIHAWTGKRFYSLFYSKGKGTTFDEPVTFLEGIQDKYNNSSLCFNKNGVEMVLTRNNIGKKKGDEDGDEVLKLKLYFSTFKDGIWSFVIPFQFNSEDYSCAHPALTPDGNRLYFSSDMPGTIGGMDLWFCNRTSTGWSAPQNLGSSINTKGNEVFPSVADANTLYFSSNGHEGIGGLDLYSTKDSDGIFSKPVNLGVPFNSSDDDFGLLYDSTQALGYLSSNRNHQGNNDDIFCIQKYTVKLNPIVKDKHTDEVLTATNIRVVEDVSEPGSAPANMDGAPVTELRRNKNYLVISERENYRTDTIKLLAEDIRASGDTMSLKIAMENEISIVGRITNEVTGNWIENNLVVLIDLSKGDTLRTTTDKDGNYKFAKLQKDRRYRIVAESAMCDSKSIDTSTAEINGSTTIRLNIGLFCLSENTVLNNIYYDLNQSNIRKDAAVELDKLVKLLKKYPTIRIELSSYTDCRASISYNMALSKRRATSAVQYLEQAGISRRRLVAVGYGESRPVNQCECEGQKAVPCTEAEHQLNRRTEVKLISIE